MIDYHFSPELEQMVDGLRKQQSPDSVFGPLNAINMMNTRYVVYDLNSQPLANPEAWGNAWFSPGFRLVNNADEEITTLDQVHSRELTVIDKRFASFVEGKTFSADSNATINLTEYQPNYLKYSSKTGSEQLVVFSEVYYADGWKAFVDGTETPHFRANYILRAMVLPAGEHTVEFRFHPAAYFTGNKVSLAGSILLLLAVTGFFITEFRGKKKASVTNSH